MKPIATYKVRPTLPEALQPLVPIAYNLRWCWDHSAIDLFRRFDRDLWETVGRNPVMVLGALEQSVLEAAAEDDSFLAHLHGVSKSLDNYLTGQGGGSTSTGSTCSLLIFRRSQYLNAAGWQQEEFEENYFHNLPIEFLPNVQVHVELPDGVATARVWRADVSRKLLKRQPPERRADPAAEARLQPCSAMRLCCGGA